MRVANLRYLSVIFLILISATSCASKIVTPDIERRSYVEFKCAQPDCGRVLSALRYSEVKSDRLILDTLFCYRSVWKYWENEYEILDAQLGAIYQK